MVTSNGEGIGLLAKLVRAIIKSEDTTEETEEAEPTERPGALEVENLQAEPMKAYWATDKKSLKNNNQYFIDIFEEGKALERISDTTEAPVKESQYKFIDLNIFQLQGTQPNQRYEYNINDGNVFKSLYFMLMYQINREDTQIHLELGAWHCF